MSKYSREEILEVIIDALKVTATNSPNRVILPPIVEEKTEFKTAHNLDSLDNVELIARLEEHFQIMMNDKKWAEMQTLGEVCDYLEKRLSE